MVAGLVYALGGLLSTVIASPIAQAQTPDSRPYGLGSPPTQGQIDDWNIDVRGEDGAGLPAGKGSVQSGRQVYAAHCVSCHGEKGEGPMDRLTGGVGTLKSEKPGKTVGSYWPYASTLFDYIHRAMPFDHPQSLSNDEVYSAVAYVLFLNDLVTEDAVIDAQSLPKVRMHNSEGFYGPDPRPDTENTLCVRQCTPLKTTRAEGDIAPSEIQ